MNDLDRLVPTEAPFSSVLLTLLALYFGYQIWQALTAGPRGWRGAVMLLLAIFYGYNLGTVDCSGCNFIERLLAATLGSLVSMLIIILNAFGANIEV